MKTIRTVSESKTPAVALRRLAEGIARGKAFRIPENMESLSIEVARQTLHELRVHQIELEMQNEELRRAQVELDVARARYFDLYDLAPVGYCTVGEQGLILEANLTAATLLGLARGALVKQQISCFIHKENQDIYYRHRKQLFETGTPQACELRMVKMDGTVLWAHLEATATQDVDGAPVCRIVMIDITERKRAEDDLKEALEQYRSLAASADSMYLVDRNCTYLFMNEMHLKRFGLSLEEVVGKRHREFHSEEDAKWFAEYVSEVCETGKPLTKEHRSERDGKYFLRTLTPIIGKSTDGKISQVAIISKDITLRKLAEKKLQDTLDSLRKAVNTTIQVMVSAVEARDPYTAGHQIRSADLARAIAAEMGLSQETIEGIRMAGSIHDLGKISIPAEILSKPTKLSEIEFSLVKEHAHRGFEMLKDVESPYPLAEIVYQHHERMDGSGYPRKLKGEEILIEARILTVADVVEAMASHRPYRAGLGIDAALEEIETNRGTFYDEAVVDVCLRVFRDKGYLFVER